MTTMIYRTFTPDLEVRSDGDGRTIRGIAVPWGVPQRIDARLTEQWASGAFDHQLNAPNRVRFAREHVELGGTLIGVATLLRNDTAGLYGEWRVSQTPKGDETLALTIDRALSQLSIGFRERQNRRLPSGTVERVTADLFEVAVTMAGAFGELAAVTGVRSAEAGTPLLDEARQVLARLPLLPLPR